MTGFWGGIFVKHRDFMHNSVLEHLGIGPENWPTEDDAVMLDVDPITGKKLVSEKKFYQFVLDLPVADGDQKYKYFVPADPKSGGPPTKAQAEKYLEQYMKTVDEEHPREKYLDEYL